jgi:hypothetical protein
VARRKCAVYFGYVSERETPEVAYWGSALVS